MDSEVKSMYVSEGVISYNIRVRESGYKGHLGKGKEFKTTVGKAGVLAEMAAN